MRIVCVSGPYCVRSFQGHYQSRNISRVSSSTYWLTGVHPNSFRHSMDPLKECILGKIHYNPDISADPTK